MDASKMSRNQQRDRVNVDDVPVGGGQAQDTEDGTSGGDGLHAGSEKTPILARGASGASPSAGYAPAGFKLELLLTLPPDHLMGADQVGLTKHLRQSGTYQSNALFRGVRKRDPLHFT